MDEQPTLEFFRAIYNALKGRGEDDGARFLQRSYAPHPRDSSAKDSHSHQRRGEARGRSQERQLAEGPNEILAALNLWHRFRLGHRDPSHPQRARRLQLALGPSGKSFYGTPPLLGPLVEALEVMAGFITNTGLHERIDSMVTNELVGLNLGLTNARVEVNVAIEKILGPHRIQGQPRMTLLRGNDDPEVDAATRQRALMAACIQSPGLLETMVRGMNYHAAMALLARLSAAPPEWRGRVYRCNGSACRAPYQIWLAQPGAGRRPKRGAKPAAPTGICRVCRAQVSRNSCVKPAKSLRRIPA